MSVSKSTERKIGVVFSYIQIVLSILISILYTPYMIRTLGQNEYGLYGTINSAIGLISILDLGFSSSYIKFYSSYKITKQYDKINSFNSLFFLVFAAIATVAGMISLFLSFNLDLVFDTGLTSEEYQKARVMMLLMTLSMFLGFITTVYSCYINAHEKFIFQKSIGFGTTILSLVLNILVLFIGSGVIGLVLVGIAVSILTKLINIIYAYKKLHFKFNFKGMEKQVFKQVFSFSFLIAINIIVDKINQGIDSVLLGRFCGTAVVAVYSVGASLNSHFTTLSTAISGIFVPKVHTLVNSYKMDSPEQRQAITSFFVKVGRIQYLLLALVASGVVFFGQPFIRFWAGEGYEEAYYIALVMLLPSIVPLTQNVGIEIQRAENRHHYRSYLYGAMAIINLIISIFLCQILGGLGSAIGTGFACVVANIVLMNLVYHKKINVDVTQYWKNILRQTLGMLPAFAVGTLIMCFAKMDSILSLGVYILIYTAVYGICIWFFSMNGSEKRLFTGVLQKLASKRKKGNV